MSRTGWVSAFVAVVVLTGCATTSRRPTLVIAAGEPAPGDAAFARQMALRLNAPRVLEGTTFHRTVEEQTGPNPHRAQ